MPFDGSGNFNRALGPTTWQNDAAAGIKIKADLHDNNDNDIANGLSNTICKDGQSSPTADITLNGHKLINVANPSNPQDVMTLNTFAASAVRYDAAQALSIAQQLIAHTNLAATKSVAVKSGAYSLLQADRGKLLRITGAATITLPTAATVGNDFSADFRTMGGVLTLDPNGTDQIEGANADFKIADLTNATLWSDGAAWWVGTTANAPATGTVIERVFDATAPWTKPLPPAGLKYIKVRGQGPGGGTGGILNPGAGLQMGCGGAGAGAYGEKTIMAVALTDPVYTVTIGAPGVAGNTSGTAGGTGGTSSFGGPGTGGGVGTQLCTFPGGDGSSRSTAVSVLTRIDGGAQSAVPTGCDLAIPGQAGDATLLVFTSLSVCLLGSGGRAFWGTTFSQNNVFGSIAALPPPGGWGSGARSPVNIGSVAAKAGADGGNSRIIVTEYY